MMEVCHFFFSLFSAIAISMERTICLYFWNSRSSVNSVMIFIESELTGGKLHKTGRYWYGCVVNFLL